MTLLLFALVAGPITVPEIHDFVNSGCAEEVLPRAESAAAAAPDDRPIQKAFALVLRSIGELDSAIAVYNRLLASDPADDDTRLGLGLVLSWQGRLADAFALYEEIRPGSEHYFDAVIGKGRVAGWMGRYREALRFFDEADSISPGNRKVLERRAQVTGWSGDHARAISLYRQLLERSPGNPDYLFALGQNHEWSGMPVSARSYYRQALSLAPGRKDVAEALLRVEEAAAWRTSITYSDAADYDGDVQGRYRNYRFRFEPRLGDRFHPVAALSWSGNRRGTLGQNYLFFRAGLSGRPRSWLNLSGQVQGDVFTFAFKAATLNWEVERSWFSWTGDIGRIPYEPAQDIGAFSGSTQLVVRPRSGLRLSGSAGRTHIINDGNDRTSLSVCAGFDFLSRPRLGVSYTLSYDDFRFRSPRYYSPPSLLTNLVGINLTTYWKNTSLSADAAGGANAVGEWLVRANGSLDWRLASRTSLTLEANYAQTMVRGRYLYASLALGVARSF